jgi:hypothetical protein
VSADPAMTLWSMLAGTSEPGYLEFRFRLDGQWEGPCFIESTHSKACLRLMRQEHASVGAIPRRKPEPSFLARANVLWARLDTGKHAEALARFRSAPTMVLREGKSPRRVALWALAEPLKIHHAEQANKRIAHALGTRKKWAAAESDLHPPGTTLVLGTKPVQVWAEHLDPGALFMARGVVGHLRDAPAPHDWKKERAAA